MKWRCYANNPFEILPTPQAQAALASRMAEMIEAVSAIALGLAGDSAQATRLTEDLAKRFLEDLIVQFDYLPMDRKATTYKPAASR